jgi:hypothetical protein
VRFAFIRDHTVLFEVAIVVNTRSQRLLRVRHVS